MKNHPRCGCFGQQVQLPAMTAVSQSRFCNHKKAGEAQSVLQDTYKSFILLKNTGMATDSFSRPRLNPRQVIENITLKKIMLQYPETATYQSLIKFNHTGDKASLDLTLLPQDLIKKIEALFA